MASSCILAVQNSDSHAYAEKLCVPVVQIYLVKDASDVLDSSTFNNASFLSVAAEGRFTLVVRRGMDVQEVSVTGKGLTRERLGMLIEALESAPQFVEIDKNDPQREAVF